MKYEVNNLLDINYLNNTIKSLGKELSKIKVLPNYELDSLEKMEITDVKELFIKYDVSCLNMIKYLESDFIDDEWEYADLFLEDMVYSNDLKESLKYRALEELDALNDKINLNNQELEDRSRKIEEDIVSFKRILEILDKNYFVLEEDILWLIEFVYKQELSEIDLYRFSRDISKVLIAKNKQILETKEKEDVSLFESSLDDVYKEKNEDTPICLEEVIKYYNKYKSVFDKVRLGVTLEEVMELSNELILSFDGINSLDDFCISMGALFYKIYAASDEGEQEQLLVEVDKLDKLYEERFNKIDGIVLELDNTIRRINRIPNNNLTNDFCEKVISSLENYKKELLNNIFVRDLDSSVKFNLYANKTVNQVIYLMELNNEIVHMLQANSNLSGVFTDADYLDLSTKQTELLYYIDLVMQDGYSDEVEEIYYKYLDDVHKYILEDSLQGEKTMISGFVLFDFDSENVPYVVSDLDPHSRNNLIDTSILQGKCDSGFEDFNTLINDLHMYGTLKTLHDEASNYNLYKLINPVYSDKNSRKNPTGMVRTRPSKSSLVRFISRDVVLKPDTEIYIQVVNILEEILPGLQIDNSREFRLIINFAASMKGSSEDSYRECILRYDRQSPLYRLFFSDTSKVKLSLQECDLLRDIILMSLDAYFKLENVNDKLHFDIIRQLGGKRVYGK